MRPAARRARRPFVIFDGMLTVTGVTPTVEALTPLAGVVVGAVITWVVARLAAREQRDLAQAARDEANREALTERTSAFVAATYHAVLSQSDLAMAPMERKARIWQVQVWPTMDRVNTALVAIKVNDPDDLVKAVTRLDRALVALKEAANETTYTAEEWSTKRDGVIGTLPEDAIQVARRHARALATGTE